MKIKILFSILLMLAFTLCFADDVSNKLPKYGDQEVALGRQNVEEIAKNYKFVEDPAYVDRVNRIGSKIAKVANETKINAMYGSSILTPFNYEFRVIDSADVNAFSVMGGFIYINKGIIDFCESDDELAGIIAHEIIHAAHHHLVYLIDEQTKFNQQAMLAILVGIFAAKGNAQAISGVATASNLYQIAMVNGYSQQAERDSDNGAFTLIVKAGFNPVGLLTPLERLSQEPDYIDMGIYRSHPITKERVAAVKALLKDANIPLDRAAVSGKINTKIENFEKDGLKFKKIYLEKTNILIVPYTDEAIANVRCNQIVNTINKALKENIDLFDVKSTDVSVLIKSKPVFSPTKEEAQAMQMDIPNIVKKCSSAIRSIVLDRKQKTIV